MGCRGFWHSYTICFNVDAGEIGTCWGAEAAGATRQEKRRQEDGRCSEPGIPSTLKDSVDGQRKKETKRGERERQFTVVRQWIQEELK